MLRPDCIDPTLNKPSICPIVPLKKYMDQDGKNVGKVYFGPTIVGNALNKAIKSPISIVSSTNIDRAMKGFGKTRSTKTEKVAEDDNEEEEQEEEQEEEEAEEVEDEQSDELDFVPLGKDEYEDYVESEESEDDNGEEEEDNESSNEELAQAMEKIQQLEKDAAHWKQLCVEMQSFIQHHPDGKQVPIVDSTSEEKKRKRNRKRNKNKAVSDDNEEEEAEEAEPVVEEKVSEAGTKKQKKQKLLREQATKQDTEEEDYIEQEKQFAVKAKKFKAVDPSDAEYQTKFSKAERKRQKLLSLRKAAM